MGSLEDFFRSELAPEASGEQQSVEGSKQQLFERARQLSPDVVAVLDAVKKVLLKTTVIETMARIDKVAYPDLEQPSWEITRQSSGLDINSLEVQLKFDPQQKAIFVVLAKKNLPKPDSATNYPPLGEIGREECEANQAALAPTIVALIKRLTSTSSSATPDSSAARPGITSQSDAPTQAAPPANPYDL